LINDLFSYHSFLYPVRRLIDIYYQNKTSFQGNIIAPLEQIKDKGIVELLQVGTSFKKQLEQLCETDSNPEKDNTIQKRIKKGISYFINHTNEFIKNPIEEITFSTDNKAVKKDFTKQLDNLEEHLANKLFCLNGLSDGFSITKYLELRAKAVLQKSENPLKSKLKKRAEVTSTDHPKLFEELRELRHMLANSENVSHFQIFTQKSLFEMCTYFPTTPKQLKTINGMGKIRVKKYGEEILDIIKKYINDNDVESKEVKYIDVKKELIPKINTKQHSLNLYKQGKTIDEVAKERGLTKGTIENHLSYFIKTGEIKITELIPKVKYLELKKIIETTKFEGVGDLKHKIDDKFTYLEMRMVATIIEIEKKT
jgi:hypothetical protein